ncbi:hypothetical protein HY768_11790 [candidate division TA06 bacterium]|uniref:Uncharacterized protein n=1 Tax=candidate division TA06 bacterium TaxID=2250710 RepID=A0A933ICP2_UNCT6|nr:hypothetical protein [candidate division TA06 bacterium]
MQQQVLFKDEKQKGARFELGAGLTLEAIDRGGKQAGAVILYRQGVFIKKADLSDAVARRLFIVEAVELGAGKSRLAVALGISRQSIHNQIEIKKHFGQEGLIQGYNPAASKSRRRQRQLHQQERGSGNKSVEVAQIRAREREEREAKQLKLEFSFTAGRQRVEAAEQPFAEEHDWEASRYAGAFLYLMALAKQWNWLELVMGYFGAAYKIFMVFVLMAAANIGSIEQLKNVRVREAGIVLGIRRVACKPIVWEWFYSAAQLQVSQFLRADFFRYQLRAGLVGLWMWFCDGHLLPYTGKHQLRSAYNTQRRMPVPGRTNMVSCDGSGRVVDFEIQEGKGDLRAHIVALGKKWAGEVSRRPVMVFDREGSGEEFFASLVKERTPFVTWEKHADADKLAALEESRFITEFIFNGKQYGVFEEEKSFTVGPQPGETQGHEVTLRRIYVWNKTSKRRASGLAWSGTMNMSTQECAQAILSRWGASENTFKHLNDRHPFHYHPGFKLVESDRQDIANPEIKRKENLIAGIKNGLNKLYKKLVKAKAATKKDGTPRGNSVRQRLESTIAGQESALATAQEEKKLLPERVDVSGLENYKSIKRVDDEGKYLFDFVTASVWNARKQMVDWLRPHFDAENELVDLFYAITNCQGWIRSTKTEVTVRLEPLQQPRRRLAQEQLCRRLTNLGARTPAGKWLVVEVGEGPV